VYNERGSLTLFASKVETSQPEAEPVEEEELGGQGFLTKKRPILRWDSPF
jgi:hypothetical protein